MREGTRFEHVSQEQACLVGLLNFPRRFGGGSDPTSIGVGGVCVLLFFLGLPSSSSLARCGGSEFVVWKPICSPEAERPMVFTSLPSLTH